MAGHATQAAAAAAAVGAAAASAASRVPMRAAGQASQSAPQKRRAQPLDQLPYQRKHAFHQRAHRNLEDRLHDMVLDAQAGTKELRVVLGRVVGRASGREIVLPVSSEAVLDGADHEFQPALSNEAQAAVREQLGAARERWQADRAAPPRWADVSVEERPRDAAEADECLSVYCPGGSWHYQVGLFGPSSSDVKRQGKELIYRFQKEPGEAGLWWGVSLCTFPGCCTCELSVGMRLVSEQRQRLRSGKVHSLSLILRDLLRNARAILGLLRQPGAAQAKEVPRLYYPSILEPGRAVQDFYATKATVHTRESPNEKIRRYNNLVKTLLIERFLDPVEGPVRVLDLCCGQGQDLYKYSRAFRRASIENYVGVDFAESAVAEARRRYAVMLQTKSSRDIGEYAANIYVGDVRQPETLQRLAPHGPFDVVSMQFCLHYFAESQESVKSLFARLRGLLKPGGRILGTMPSSEVLADLFRSACDPKAGDSVGNDLYRVKFRHDDVDSDVAGNVDDAFNQRWGLPYTFTLVDAVEAQEEYVVPWGAFEELVGALGLSVVLDASFQEVLDGYKGSSPYYAGHFSRDARNTQLTAAEKDVFDLYSCFVLEYSGAPAAPGAEVGD